jgi:hypothetical protein
MPLQKLTFKPGVNRESTNYANEGGYYDCDHIRFRSGQPEKIGGWTRLSNEQYAGICRSLWNWSTLSGANYLGMGTSKKYYIEYGTAFYDITPYIYSDSPALSGPFSVTTGNTTMTITDAQYSPNIGDSITITGAVGLGGNITATVLNKNFVVTGKGTGNYTVTLPIVPGVGNTGTGGAAVVIKYEYPIGNDIATTGTGWGTGPWPPGTPVALGNNPFATTNGSGTITVTQTAHGYTTTAGAFVVGREYRITSIGSTDFTLIGASANTVGVLFFATGVGSGSGTASVPYVYFTGATATGGISASVLNITYLITVTGVNTYTILTPGTTTNNSNAGTIVLATSTATGGGSSVIAYPQSGTRGWGSGYTSGVVQQLRLWTNDNFGEDLLIAPRGGAIAYWSNATTVSARAVLLSTLAGAYAPVATNQVIASSIQRFVIAMGSNSYVVGDPNTDFDPMLVRWSDQINPFQWVPDITNQSGEFRLSNGSFIMQALTTRQEILIWTDSALYSMQYLGAPYVWGFNVLADNISTISPKAAITVNNTTYWMGREKFYVYNGRVETLPCTLRQFVFNDLNQDQAYQIFAGSNEGYNEVWWFYCSANSDVVDKYVIYNYLDNAWYYGTMGRTAWLDSGIRQYPMAANYQNRILYHENGVDDVSGETPVAIDAYVQSSDFDIGDGYNFGFVWRILPDVNFNGSISNEPSVTMTVKPRQNSGSAYGVADNPAVVSADNYTTQKFYNIQQFTGQVYTRIRGRQMSFRIESDAVGVAWQLGAPRIDIKPDGKR